MKSSRSFVVTMAGALSVLTACGASTPPTREVINELIDTAEQDGEPLTDDVKACMHEVADGFTLTDDDASNFNDLDAVFNRADEGDETANKIVERLGDELKSCNTPG